MAVPCLVALVASDIWAATVAPAVLPARTFRVTRVVIATPTGDPVNAGSADNEFTFMGAAGVATIPVQATVTPAADAATIGSSIKWTIDAVPPGSTLTWDHPWPGEPTAGQGVNAVATLTGYPTSNAGFGARTIKMEVIQGARVVTTRTTPIELFFERDMPATGRTDPNWYFYWLEAIGGRANTIYGGAGAGLFGEAPGMLQWSYPVAPNKTRVIVYDAARLVDTGDPCVASGVRLTTGIDAFVDTVLHENHHTVQIAAADAVVGTAAGTSWRFGWSWNQGANNNH